MKVVVIGAGIAGLTSALMARRAGCDVTVLTTGFGGLQLGAGTVDVLDAAKPLEAMASLPEGHPYHQIKPEAIKAGVEAFSTVVPLEGSLEEATTMPTAFGALRRTSFYPASMAAGKVEEGAHYLLVGFSGLKDFYPKLAAENLRDQGVEARAELIDFAADGGDTALQFSRKLALEGEAEKLGRRLASLAEPGEKVGIPAVAREADFARIVATSGGLPIFQIPLMPPSIPGLEQNETARALCAQERVRMYLNAKAVGVEAEGGKITAVLTEVAGKTRPIEADAVIYAAGGLESGAIELDSYRKLHETVFELPLTHAEELIHGDYWGVPQPLFAVGVSVDADMRPVGATGEPVYENLYAAGGILAGAQRTHEKSGEGIALGSAATAVAAITRSIA